MFSTAKKVQFSEEVQVKTIEAPEEVEIDEVCEEYCKAPKFLDPRKLCCNLPKIQTWKPNLRVSGQ